MTDQPLKSDQNKYMHRYITSYAHDGMTQKQNEQRTFIARSVHNIVDIGANNTARPWWSEACIWPCFSHIFSLLRSLIYFVSGSSLFIVPTLSLSDFSFTYIHICIIFYLKLDIKNPMKLKVTTIFIKPIPHLLSDTWISLTDDI